MTVLEMLNENINFLDGKVVAYDFGGSAPIKGKVVSSRKNIQSCKIDDEDAKIKAFSISFNGLSYYTVSCNNVEVIG